MDPRCLLLGLPDGNMHIKHKRLVDFYLQEEYFAFWIKGVVLTMKSWHSLIKESIPNEYTT